MKISKRLINSVFLSFAILGTTGIANSADKKVRVGIVDPSKVVKQYPLAVKTLKDIEKAEAILKAKVNAKRKAIEEARNQEKTQTELQMMLEQFRQEIEPETKRLEEDSLAKSKQVETNVNNAIDKVAKDEKFDLILLKQAVLFGGTDINTAVLKQLAKVK